VTASASAHTIGYVPGRTSRTCRSGRVRLVRVALTKRRAVDFCRVATALCLPVPRQSQPAVNERRLAAS
jgi:hypothetical protein